MIYTKFCDLEKLYSSKKLIYMIISTDAFDRSDIIKNIVQITKKDNTTTIKTLKSDALTTIDLCNNLESYSLFGDKSIIILKDAEELKESAIEVLKKYFLNPNPAVQLIISASKINRATNFYKKAAEHAIVIDLPEVKPWEKANVLTNWLIAYAAKNNKKIAKAACQHLVTHVSNDKSVLYNEMEKLFCYTGEKPSIEKEDVIAVCLKTNLDTIFELCDAILLRNTSKALTIVKSMLNNEVFPLAIIAQIRRQLQTGFHVCSMVKTNQLNNISKIYSYMRGYILEKNIKMSTNYGYENFKKALIMVNDCETDIKNSSADANLLIEKLIIKLG